MKSSNEDCRHACGVEKMATTTHLAMYFSLRVLQIRLRESHSGAASADDEEMKR
jgi:hypothetical protein